MTQGFQKSELEALQKIPTVIRSLASLAPRLSFVAPTTLPEVANIMYNNPDSSKL
jgi:hypothetical protein